MAGKQLYMMSPLAFMSRPELWMDCISKYKVTHTCAPNFAYSMIFDKFFFCSNSKEGDSKSKLIKSWDLSSLQVMMNAGEPIDPIMMKKLHFELSTNCQLSLDSYCPSYGMAEGLITAGGCGARSNGMQQAATTVIKVDGKALSQGKIIMIVDDHWDDDDASGIGVPIAGCGYITDNVPVAIVDEKNREEVLDIGPETANKFSEIVRQCKTVVWNGPMGVFEMPPFDQGTKAIAGAIAETDCTSIIGGGDSAAAIAHLGFESSVTHVSTGGGASLAMLEGKDFQALEVLDRKSAVTN